MKRILAGLVMAMALAFTAPVWAQSQSFCGPFQFPCWTTAARPVNPGAGTTGYNVNLQVVEWWNGSGWVSGGGGGGGSGTVTSVALALPASVFNISGSPVTI